jgi:hypothetical protein
VPEHILFPVLALIETDGINTGLTVIVIALLVADSGLAHEALLVTMQVIILPFVKVADEKVLLLIPALIPFIFH